MYKKNLDAVRLGRLGGKARLKTMTPEERSRRAKHAVSVREERRKKGTTQKGEIK